MSSGVSLGFAFSAGLIASLNPCAFAMLPAYVAYYLGLDEEAGGSELALRRAGRAVLVGAAMTAGFLVVFAGIGLLVSLAGSRLLHYQDAVAVAVALALVALGTWLAAGRELHVFVPNPAARRRQGRGLASALVYGVGYGFASLACTLPIFLVVVGNAFVAGSVLGGLGLFVAYSLGMGAVVVAVTLGAALFKGVVARFLRRSLPLVQRASGALLILAGTYLAVRQLEEAQLGTLSALQPHATEIGAGLALVAIAAAAVLWWLEGGDEIGESEFDRPPVEPAIGSARRLWTVPRRRLLLPLAAGVLALGAGAGATFALGRGGSTSRVTGDTLSRAVPPMPLLDSQGRTTSLAAFRGKVVVLAPFLTLCGEVCPLTEGAFLQMRRALVAADLGNRVQLVEVSVDPWRDSPARLRAFSRLIRSGSGITMLTGSRAQIARFWHFFGVDYWKEPQGVPADVDWWTHKPERFDVGHTAALFFLDARGRERIVIVGMADLAGNLSPRLESLLNAEGRHDLAQPPQGATWTVGQALADVRGLLGSEPVASTLSARPVPAAAPATSPGRGSRQRSLAHRAQSFLDGLENCQAAASTLLTLLERPKLDALELGDAVPNVGEFCQRTERALARLPSAGLERPAAAAHAALRQIDAGLGALGRAATSAPEPPAPAAPIARTEIPRLVAERARYVRVTLKAIEAVLPSARRALAAGLERARLAAAELRRLPARQGRGSPSTAAPAPHPGAAAAAQAAAGPASSGSRTGELVDFMVDKEEALLGFATILQRNRRERAAVANGKGRASAIQTTSQLALDVLTYCRALLPELPPRPAQAIGADCARLGRTSAGLVRAVRDGDGAGIGRAARALDALVPRLRREVELAAG